jgi:hypothetical protein
MDMPGIGPISWWPISHFLLFLILGFLFPDCGVFIITAGILWEIFESIMAIIQGGPQQTVKSGSGNSVEYEFTWWAGSFKDIFMNTTGFFIGKGMRNLLEGYFGPLPFNCCQSKKAKMFS